jgi:hypothetical protein
MNQLTLGVEAPGFRRGGEPLYCNLELGGYKGRRCRTVLGPPKVDVRDLGSGLG